MNVNKDGTPKDLSNEPGFPELMTLYLDDNYDYSNGTFTGMSESTKKQFFKDLQTFYTAFTGNTNMPPEITKFSDIKLRDYRDKQGCQGESPVFKNKYVINKKDKLFINYAENVKKMIKTAANNQHKLLSVINELFTYVLDPYSGKRVIRINPTLNDEILQKSVEKTRRFIVDLYVTCENDYVNGVKLYEAIVESKIIETTQNQIKNLKNKATQIIESTKKTVSPVNINQNTNVEPMPITNVEPMPITNVEPMPITNVEPMPITNVQPMTDTTVQPKIQVYK
jgi:hypothetical protein